MDYREDQTIVDFRNEVQDVHFGDNLPDDWGTGCAAARVTRPMSCRVTRVVPDRDGQEALAHHGLARRSTAVSMRRTRSR